MLANIALSLLLASSARAQLLPPGWKPINTGQWGGLSLTLDSSRIDGDCQACQNVLTDNGYLETRPGNTFLAAIDNGYPVSYCNEWLAPTGTRYLIAQSSNAVWQTNFSSAAVSVSSISASFNISTVPQFSRLFFADGYRPLWYFDGNSTATVTDIYSGIVAPVCTYLEAQNSRLWCANLPNEGSSRVRISSSGGAGYWVVPYNVANVADAPNVFDFNPDDGDNINCIKATPWGMFIGKGKSSYIEKGTSNATYHYVQIDPRVGCTDNRSVQMVYGVLVWLALDGIYGYNGAGTPQLLSRELDPLVNTIQQEQFLASQWATQLTSDWNAGISSVSAWNLNSVPGEIFPSSSTFIDNAISGFSSGTYLVALTTFAAAPSYLEVSSIPYIVRNGDFALGTNGNPPLSWTCVAAGAGGYCGAAGTDCGGFGGNISPTGGCIIAQRNGGVSDGFVQLTDENDNVIFQTKNYSQDATVASGGHTINLLDRTISSNTLAGRTLKIRFEGTGNGGNETMVSGTFTAISSVSWSSTEYNDGGRFGWVNLQVYVNGYYNGTTQSSSTLYFQSRIFDTGFTSPVSGILVSSSTLPGKTGVNGNPIESNLVYQVRSSSSPNNDLWSSWTASNGNLVALAGRYWEYGSSFTMSIPTITAQLDSVQIGAISTGIYYSKVDFIGTGVTAWRQFGVNISSVANDPTIYNYYVRTATYSFLATATLPYWTAQAPNSIITASTAAYVQFEITSASMTNADNAYPVSGVFVHYSQGNNIPVASGMLERRYYLCVTVSTASTTLDTCLVRQKTGKWIQIAWPEISSMGLFNNNLIIGSSATDSAVFYAMQPGVYSDSGTAINAQWISDDFDDGLPFNDKVLYEIWTDNMAVANSSVTVSYAVNKSTSFVDSTFYLGTPNAPLPSQIPTVNPQAASIIKWTQLNAGSARGKLLRFKFSNKTAGNYFRVNSYSPLVQDQPRTVP